MITEYFTVHLGYESGLNLHTSGWWLGNAQKIVGYGKFTICVKSEDDVTLTSSEGVSLVWIDTIDANPTSGEPWYQQFAEWIVQYGADPLAAFPIEVWGNFTYSQLETIVNAADI